MTSFTYKSSTVKKTKLSSKLKTYFFMRINNAQSHHIPLTFNPYCPDKLGFFIRNGI